jgi:hypothetical protein
MAFYGAENGTTREIDQKYLEIFGKFSFVMLEKEEDHWDW